METKQCKKCLKIRPVKDFYKKRSGEYFDLCKDCLTMHVDNFEEETFLWILEEADVPYVPSEWNILRDRAYARNPKLNGRSVLGKYFAKMKLKQWKNYGWTDGEQLRQQEQEKAEQIRLENEQRAEELKEALEKGDISEAEYRTLTSTVEQIKQEPMLAKQPEQQQIDASNPFNETPAFVQDIDLPDPAADLTDDDKKYLAMKWGLLYKPSEWLKLEQQYHEMEQSFDIQDADTINTLKLLCKTYLKMDQAIDIGDIQGYQQLSKVYDAMRKSAKFQAVQNKTESGELVDCVGNLVKLCERTGGFLPTFATDVPQDKIDFILKNNNDFLKKTIENDLGFAQQIEDTLRKINASIDENAEEDIMSLEDKPIEEVTDEDYIQQFEAIQEQIDADIRTIEEELKI